jgi:CheY-like chemotaxis protein
MANILIVDDRPPNRQYLSALLAYANHNMFEAENGAEALDIARVRRPDLVITDILMPSMDGYQFTKQLRADPLIASTPVIFYTATYREREARALAESCGVRTVLPKPSSPEAIMAAVNSELAKIERPPAQASPPAVGAVEAHELTRMSLLLTDITMPNGMNGREFALHARRIRPALKVLFMSGFSQAESGDPVYSDEVESWLDKPFRRTDLAQKVRTVLDQG